MTDVEMLQATAEQAAVRSAMEIALPEVFTPRDEVLYGGLDDKTVAYMKMMLARNPGLIRSYLAAARMRAGRVQSPRAEPDWIYFVQQGRDGPIKIGVASDVAARINQLQTGSAEPLRLLSVRPGSRVVERQLHERFTGHRIRGEWFSPSDELMDYIGGSS